MQYFTIIQEHQIYCKFIRQIKLWNIYLIELASQWNAWQRIQWQVSLTSLLDNAVRHLRLLIYITNTTWNHQASHKGRCNIDCLCQRVSILCYFRSQSLQIFISTTHYSSRFHWLPLYTRQEAIQSQNFINGVLWNTDYRLWIKQCQDRNKSKNHRQTNKN